MRRASPGTRVTLICPECDSAFQVVPFRIREGARFCSQRCAGQAGTRKRTGSGIASQFWDELVATATGCREWPHARSQNGYGRVAWIGKRWAAHRLAWTLTHGEIPSGLCVLHQCDNRPCCEPTHLQLGTQAENSRQMIERRRSAKGSRRPNARLTESTVQGIKAALAGGTSGAQLAREHRVSAMTISDIARGKTWTHV